MDDKTFQDLPEVFAQRYQKVYDHYLSMVGEHVKAMGEIRASDIHKLNELAKMNANVSRIKIELNNLIKQNTEDLYIAFAKVSEAEYKSFANLYATSGLLQGDITGNVWLVKQINSIAKTTSDTFRNMANTTVMKQLYKGVVDEAVIAVSSGVVGYNKAISDTIKKTAINGNVVEYASGLTRRRDSAVRMNVLEGIRQINAGISEATGKEFGADGVEISAHALCAQDHIHIQGRQYSNEEFEKLNNSLDRAIGTLNCNHFTFPILLGISSPVYSKQELEARTKNSMELIDIDGVQKTRYQWSQQQRRIETEVRKQKDIANIAKASGDDMLRRTAQSNINRYSEAYKQICAKTGLEPKADRLAVKGFRGVKGLKNAAGHDIIAVKRVTLQGIPNSITQVTRTNGGVERNYYGFDGKQIKQIANNNHSKEKQHPFGTKGEHAHDYIWKDDGTFDRTIREITEIERKENGDIL